MKNIEYKATDYPSGLTKKQWEEIRMFFPEGNKSSFYKSLLAETVLYLVKTVCQRRLPPNDCPKWGMVKPFYYRVVANSTRGKVIKYLERKIRLNAGWSKNLPYALIDSQSVKTVADADNCGYD